MPSPHSISKLVAYKHIVAELRQHALTALLFTWSDFKTILFPVIAFAIAVTLVHSNYSIFWAFLWTWVHLLQANISNQCDSKAEDRINKPWRPLPADRMTVSQARALRWYVVGVCQITSVFFGVTQASTLLTLTTILHDDLNLSNHWVGKTLCNSFGYFSFELGATQIIAGSANLTSRCAAALLSSVMIILLTIHAQDFADVEGDLSSGRITLPIAYPRASRVYICAALPICSISLSLLWSPQLYVMLPLISLSFVVGGRYFCFRTAAEDSRTYILYNIWLLSTHLVPAFVL
ncbi:hypothetical protein C8R46DRAFT_978664 [Mycena filopes]|nr:hypothetical protein C8R46DRAFT_978664 [Mycena filopes]